MYTRVFALALLVVFAAASAAAQPQASVVSDIGRLAEGWESLQQGRSADAVRIADALLARDVVALHAIALKIEALSSGEPLPALDAYEAWLTRPADESPHLLAPIARRVLERGLASSSVGVELRTRALVTLSAAGVETAGRELERMREAGDAPLAIAIATGRSDVVLAELDRLTAAGPGFESRQAEMARVLGDAGAQAEPALSRLLASPHAEVRAAAVRSLGRIGAAAAIPEILQTLKDRDMVVRLEAAVALARLGNQAGEEKTLEMLQSPSPEIRILAAEGWQGRPGPWVEAIRPSLEDPNGITRLLAARVIAPIDPAAAARTLAAAGGSDNPVVRAESLRIADELAEAGMAILDMPALRAGLRDADPAVQVQAAILLLQRARRGR